MVVVAAAQMLILSIEAVVIWYFTAPGRAGPGRHGVVIGGFMVGPWLTLAVGLVVLCVGAALTARWIIRPLLKLEATASALGQGDLSARSGLVRDDELGRLASRIDDMGDQIQRMLANERELLANVAHELRTPLSRIGVALDLAGEGDGQRARASLGEIAVDVAELEVIVDDILTALRYDISRGASLPLHRERTAPAAIAAASTERMRVRHPDRPLELSLVGELVAIDVDPVLFRRAIDNLLENAHKYTPDRVSPIQFVVRAAADRVEFVVIDRGIGIATADLPNIYNSFFRAERSRSRETGGVGLGLTLAKRIVEAHGGTIEVTSTIGHGTRARVSVPAASRSATQPTS
jgi:signal transduction histidine kinase